MQHYITAVIAFLIVEMAFNYGFFEDYNTTGVVRHSLLAIVVLLNAGRNSISFFMILIVSLGYGVVKPTLGGTMKLCMLLGIAHFIFGALYASGALLTNDVNSSFVFLMAIPLSLTMTIFYRYSCRFLYLVGPSMD